MHIANFTVSVWTIVVPVFDLRILLGKVEKQSGKILEICKSRKSPEKVWKFVFKIA